MKKPVEDAIIFVTGIASSIICIVGYNVASDEDLLNGSLLLFLGVGLFCGVAYAVYGHPRPTRKSANLPASKLREVKPLSAEALSKGKTEDRTAGIDRPRPAATPHLVPSSAPSVSENEPRKPEPGTQHPSVEVGQAAEPTSVEPDSSGPQSVPAARKAVASMTAQDDEVTAANNLLQVYTELLTKLTDPAKQRTLKRWIAQQEEIIKTNKSTPAKRA